MSDLVVPDYERSEHGPQRRKASNGRLLHCCCICGRLDTWGQTWSCYCSIKDMDDEAAYPKFCSEPCRERGGGKAKQVTEEMKSRARESEWRDPTIHYRPATEREKYSAALRGRRKGSPPPLPVDAGDGK